MINTKKILFELTIILSKNSNRIPEKPSRIPKDLKKVIFSFFVKKWASIDPDIGVVLISIAAK